MRHNFQHIFQSPWIADLYNRYLPDKGFFVEIGMGHTTTGESRKSNLQKIEFYGSNTIELLDIGWEGIFIEPVAEFCYEAILLLKDKNNFKIINNGASNKFELCTMYGGETLIPNGILSYKDGATGNNYDYPGKKVLCKPTSTLLSEVGCPKHIDLMSIDVEGYEDKVLQGIDFNKHHPFMMIIECDKFKTAEPPIPSEYALIMSDGLNGCWIDQKGR